MKRLAALALAAACSAPANGGPLTPPGGTITAVNATSGGGLVGGGIAGSVGLGLRRDCATNQVLSWSGTAWLCGAGAPADTVEGTLTSPNLVAATGPHTVGGYAGSTASACSSGNAATDAALSAAGVLSLTCQQFVNGTGTNGDLMSWSGTGGAANYAGDSTCSTSAIASLSAAGTGTCATGPTFPGKTTLQDLVVGPDVIAPTLNTTENDYTPSGWSTHAHWHLTGATGGSTITGLAALGDDNWRVLMNLGTTTITFTNEDARSALANRILTPNGAPIAMQPKGAMIVHYETANSRWYVVVTPGQLNPTLGDPQWLSNAPVTLSSGTTSDWDPFSGGEVHSIVYVTPDSADSTIDGMLADGLSGTYPQSANRIICQSALNHAHLIIKASEGSSSSAANQFYINSNSNISGHAIVLGHRQCAFFHYNIDRSKWEAFIGADGTFHALTIEGAITDTSLGATVNDYTPTGTQYTSVYRLGPSGGSTTMTGLLAGSQGDIRIIRAFGALTLADSNAGSSAANRFYLPGSTDLVMANRDAVILQYDTGLSGWMAIGLAKAGGGSISGLTTNTITKAASSTSIQNSGVTDNGTTVSTGTEALSTQMNITSGRSLPTTLTSGSNNNNLSISHTFSYLGLQTSTGSSATLTGMDAGLSDGEWKYLCNYGSGAVVLSSNDANSSASNQFRLGATTYTLQAPTGGNIGGCANFRYEGQNNVWVMMSHN